MHPTTTPSEWRDADSAHVPVLTYTVEQAAKMLGLCRNAAYEAVAAGQIPSLRFGRRVVVPKAAFDRMLDAAGSKEGAA